MIQKRFGNTTPLDEISLPVRRSRWSCTECSNDDLNILMIAALQIETGLKKKKAEFLANSIRTGTVLPLFLGSGYSM